VFVGERGLQGRAVGLEDALLDGAVDRRLGNAGAKRGRLIRCAVFNGHGFHLLQNNAGRCCFGAGATKLLGGKRRLGSSRWS
jgi:hypothetical protein